MEHGETLMSIAPEREDRHSTFLSTVDFQESRLSIRLKKE